MADTPPVETRMYGARVQAVTLRYLVLKGLAYVGVGVTWVTSPSPGRMAGIDWLEVITPQMVGGLWVASGVLAIIAGLAPRAAVWLRKTGWTCLIATPALIGFYFLIAWFVYLSPDLGGGYARGITSTISYGAFSVSAYLMARIYAVTLPAVAPAAEGA